MAAGIRVVKLNGGMAASAREACLKAYKEDPSITVILISLKAGGVALNLTVASHIFLMDPWWNPAAEYQAIDRAHRLGQQKPIRAVRFVVRNTVEERILRLQDKKRLVFEGTVGGDAAALGQLTEEVIRRPPHSRSECIERRGSCALPRALGRMMRPARRFAPSRRPKRRFC